MKVQVGKKYVRRDGKVTEKLINNIEPMSSYPFYDSRFCESYSAEGLFFHDEENEEDLVSEVSEQIQPPEPTGGTKHDTDKVRLDLLPPVALTKVAEVLTFGSKKYGDHNWRKGFKFSRLTGACLRHVFAFMWGETYDKETGLHHLAHAACCLLFLIEHLELGYGEDDRYTINERYSND